MSPEQLAEIIKNAECAAKRLVRYCHAHALCRYEDVRAAALCAQVRAAETYDEGRGVPFGAYTWSAAWRAALRELRTGEAPVTATHDPRELEALHGITLEVPAAGSAWRTVERPELCALAQYAPTPFNATREREWSVRVHNALRGALGDELAELAMDVIAHETDSPADYAERSGVERAEAYNMMRRVRAAIANDRELFELWKEGP